LANFLFARYSTGTLNALATAPDLPYPSAFRMAVLVEITQGEFSMVRDGFDDLLDRSRDKLRGLFL
jgi:hypothetical protein